jgi:hypothetical protein
LKRKAKRALIDKLGYASSAVTGTVVVLFLADIYVLKVNVAMNVAGIFALALFLALASGAALKTWRREIIAKPSLKLSRNAGFWIIAEAYLFGVVFAPHRTRNRHNRNSWFCSSVSPKSAGFFEDVSRTLLY